MNQSLVNKSADFLLSELNTVFRVQLSIFMREQKCFFFCHPSFQRFIHCDFLNRQKKFKVTHGALNGSMFSARIIYYHNNCYHFIIIIF